MHFMEVSLEMCFWCFREIGTTVKHRRRGWITLTKHADHASPYSYSRNNSKSNIVTACNLCNQWKGSRVFESDDVCRQYLEQKWRNRIYEEMSVLPSGVYAEAELAGVLQPEMPQRALAQEPVPRVPEMRNYRVVRGAGKEKAAEIGVAGWLKAHDVDEASLGEMLNLSKRTIKRWRDKISRTPAWVFTVLDLLVHLYGKRYCGNKNCHNVLPDNLRADAKFCSGKCRTREYLERKAEGGAKSTLTF